MYPPDLFPTLWDRVEEIVGGGRLITPDEVLTELSRMDDDVAKWAKRHKSPMVAPLSPEVMAAMTDILSRHARLMGKGGNRNGADPWVIALAKVRGAVVVTEEQAGGGTKVKIPDVCKAENIDCMSVLGVIRAEGWTF
jgi:hypothetical protein